MTKIAKPTIPGIYLYCEEGRCLTVDVRFYSDRQAGIAEHLVVMPLLPSWDRFPTPVWDLDSLNGTWFSIE